jgi:hypothetical protein
VLEHDQVAELQEWARGLRSQLLEHEWIKQALEEQEGSIEQTLRHRLRRLLGARETRSEDRA